MELSNTKKNNILKVLKSYKDGFFTVEYIKKNNKVKKINCSTGPLIKILSNEY